MKHVTHIEHLPHLGKWRVRCDQGCDLGLTATTDSVDKAVDRANLHDKAVALRAARERADRA